MTPAHTAVSLFSGAMGFDLGLERTGRLTEPPASLEAVTTMQDTASPTSAFVRECCQTGPTCEVPVDELWAAWKGWAEDSGLRAGTKQMLGRNLLSVVPQLRRSKPRGDDGRQIPTYVGITVTSDPCNDMSRGSSRITAYGAALSRDDPRPDPSQAARCTRCGGPLDPIEPGQTTHPTCSP